MLAARWYGGRECCCTRNVGLLLKNICILATAKIFWLKLFEGRYIVELCVVFIHSLACTECDDSLPFLRASSIPLYYVLFPATLLHQLFFHPPSLHLAICFLVVNLSFLLFLNSHILLFGEFCFLPFSVHVQSHVIYLTLLSLL